MNDMVSYGQNVVRSARIRARKTATRVMGAATTTLSEGDDVPWKPLSLGEGPVNANLAQLRKYLRAMRGRYISIWQLAIIAALLQGVVHYGGLCVGAYSIGSGHIHDSDYTVLCGVFVMVREFAPMVLVAIVCMPLPRRTVRMMDTLFEQIAAEETAQRTQIQMRSVEWLADEKERAARREEALRWKLHHAEGDALKRQSELRQAQQEAQQCSTVAAQHARRAAEWEGMLRQQEAAMAAAEAVTSKRVQTATRAVRAEFEARERESLRTIESLRLQLARARAAARSSGASPRPRPHSGGGGGATTTMGGSGSGGLDGVRAAGVEVVAGADNDYGSGWGDATNDDDDFTSLEGGEGDGPREGGREGVLSPLSPLSPLRSMPLLPDTIGGDCPAAVKSREATPDASPLGSPLGSPPLMRSPLRSPLRSPPPEEATPSPPSSGSRPLVTRLVESLSPLDPTADSAAAAATAAAASSSSSSSSSSELSQLRHGGRAALAMYAASMCPTAATVATASAATVSAAKARLEAQLAACCAGAAAGAEAYFGSAEEGGAVIGEMLFGRYPDGAGSGSGSGSGSRNGSRNGSVASDDDGDGDADGGDDDERREVARQSPARLRPQAKRAEAAAPQDGGGGDGSDGAGDGDNDTDGDAPSGQPHGHPPLTLTGHRSAAGADHHHRARAPYRRPPVPVRGVRRLPGSSSGIGSGSGGGSSGGGSSSGGSRERAGDEPAASGVLATVRRIAARMASEAGCAAAAPAAAAEPVPVPLRTTLRCRRGAHARRSSRGGGGGPPPARSSSNTSLRAEELLPITEDDVESVPNLDVSGLLAARRPLFHSPGLNVKAVLV